MKRKIALALTALALAATGLFAGASPVAAAGYGPCLDSSTQFFAIREFTNATTIRGIRAYIDVGSSFHMCTPAESALDDQNSSVGQIAVGESDGGPGFLTLGIVMCDGPAFASPVFCKGYPGERRFFGEWHDCTVGWDVFDFGAADTLQHRYTLNHDGNTNSWKWYIDGVLLKSLGDGFVSCLDPDTQNVKGEYQGEAHDRGDGLGIEVSPLRFSTTQVRTTSASWVIENWGTTCDSVVGNPSPAAQHCAPDDQHDLADLWTTGN